MKLNKHQYVDAVFALQDDKGNSIEATFSEINLESSDESVFKISDVDGDGNVDIVPVGTGTASLKASAVVSYTDPATGNPIVAGKDAELVEIQVEPDATLTKLVVSFTDRKDIPVVEEPAANTEVTSDPNLQQQVGENAANAGPDQQQNQEEQQQ